MIYIVIIFLIFCFNLCSLDDDFGDNFVAVIMSGALGLGIGTVLWLTLGIGIGCFVPTYEHIKTEYLCSLNDSYSISGQKFLFSGYIEEKKEIRYMSKKDKGFKINSISTDNAYIKTVETENPYLEIKTEEFVNQ